MLLSDQAYQSVGDHASNLVSQQVHIYGNRFCRMTGYKRGGETTRVHKHGIHTIVPVVNHDAIIALRKIGDDGGLIGKLIAANK